MKEIQEATGNLQILIILYKLVKLFFIILLVWFFIQIEVAVVVSLVLEHYR